MAANAQQSTDGGENPWKRCALQRVRINLAHGLPFEPITMQDRGRRLSRAGGHVGSQPLTPCEGLTDRPFMAALGAPEVPAGRISTAVQKGDGVDHTTMWTRH